MYDDDDDTEAAKVVVVAAAAAVAAVTVAAGLADAGVVVVAAAAVGSSHDDHARGSTMSVQLALAMPPTLLPPPDPLIAGVLADDTPLPVDAADEDAG